jgi:hypothetical protein
MLQLMGVASQGRGLGSGYWIRVSHLPNASKNLPSFALLGNYVAV